MINHIIRNVISPVKTSHSGHEVLGFMDEVKVSHLPIVNDQECLGIISETDLFNNDLNEAIGTYNLSVKYVVIHPDDHLFDAMKMICEHKLTILPVVSHKNQYLGYIDTHDLLREAIQSMSLNNPGAIIEIELHVNDYYLSRIVQLIESNDCKVLHASVHTIPDSTKMILNLKLDKVDITSVLQTLERYEYTILASYGLNEQFDFLQERYELLMKYLDI
jgi:acetoin utilization protein AcuB